MNMFSRWRWILVLGVLSATGVLFQPDVKAPQPQVAAVDKPTRAESRKPEPVIHQIRRAAFEAEGDAFEVRSWEPPPPPPASVAPAAPPLPFVFLGKKYEDDAWVVFLGWQDRVLIVREQDAIDGLYRVDAIRPPTLTVTYLPLKQIQTLPIGEAP